VINNEQERDEDSAYFYFVGKDGKGNEVIYNAFMCTLRAEYEMAVYELAETRMTEKFPGFKGLDQATEDQLDYLDLLVDEIEGEDEVAVIEYIHTQESTPEGIELDVCLNIDEVSNEAIEKFVTDFNNDTLQLDDTEYSFSYANDDDE
jgi:hypothetical protein